jgi:sugar phosphate isomerase/epimerase
MSRGPLRRLGIEQLSVFGLPPVDFINLVADLGCSCISTGLTGFAYNPHRYPAFSLRDDVHMRRELTAAMRDRGVVISLGEGCIIRPHSDIRATAADMDIMRELGVERLNTVSMDPDLGRSLDQLALFTEMAAERGMAATIELCPALTINTLDAAVAAVRHVGRRDLSLLLDTMHLGRSGATAAELAALDPALIGYVQLCDAPRTPSEPDYLKEATFERMVPGEGEMPLRDYLKVLPSSLTLSLEVPLRSQAEAGIGPEIRLRRCVEAARRLLAEVEAGDASSSLGTRGSDRT